MPPKYRTFSKKKKYGRTTTRKRAPYRKKSTTKRSTYSRAKPIPLSGGVYKAAYPQKQVGYLPFAKVFHARLPYVAAATFSTPATGLAGSYTYRLNSIFDPDFTGVGTQPQQYDQLAGIYGSYIVHAAKVDLEFSNPTNDSLFVGMNFYHNESLSGAIMNGKALSTISEHRNTRMVPLVNSGKQTRKLSMYVPIHTLLGIPKVVYTSDRENYASLIGANPFRSAYLEVLLLDNAGVSTGVYIRTSITYYVELYNFIVQAQS